MGICNLFAYIAKACLAFDINIKFLRSLEAIAIKRLSQDWPLSDEIHLGARSELLFLKSTIIPKLFASVPLNANIA